MGAVSIVEAIVNMGKYATYEEVKELIVSRANISDLNWIAQRLESEVSSNETNSADMAIEIIKGLLTQ